MKLAARFALNLLAPAPVAATLLAFASALIEKGEFAEDLRWLPVYVLFGYLYAILPSLAHAWFLHRRYKNGLRPRSRRALGLSAMSGLVAGIAIGAVFSSGGGGGKTFLIFAALGATTGALNGLLHFLMPASADPFRHRE